LPGIAEVLSVIAPLRKVQAPDENLLGVEVGEEHISAGRIEIQSRHVVSAERENGDVAPDLFLGGHVDDDYAAAALTTASACTSSNLVSNCNSCTAEAGTVKDNILQRSQLACVLIHWIVMVRFAGVWPVVGFLPKSGGKNGHHQQSECEE
jgi:hypothetical protein